MLEAAAEADNHGNWLLCAMMIIWVWSALIFFVRVWAKLNVKRWGVEDYIVTVAFTVSIVDIVVTQWAINVGYGLRFDEIPEPLQVHIAKALYIRQQLYILAAGLSRISTMLFVIHLACSGPQVKPGYFMVGVTGVWTGASMLGIGLRGDVQNPWLTFDGSITLHFRWICVETTGLVIELLLLLLAISLVYGLRLTWRKRLLVLSGFSARLLLLPLVAARLYLLSPHVDSDPTYTNIVPDIITEITFHFSVISASITSLRPFLRTFHIDYATDSKIASERGYQSAVRPRTQPHNSSRNIHGANTNNEKAGPERKEGFMRPNLPYPSITHVHVVHRVSTAGTAFGNEGLFVRSSVEMLPPLQQMMRADSMVIQKTVDWAVEFEQNPV